MMKKRNEIICCWLSFLSALSTLASSAISSTNFEFTAQSNWTWISGDQQTKQPGNYGAFRQAAKENKPGSRYWHSIVIDSNSNQLYLFGGSVVGGGGSSEINDLWRWNPEIQQWTWLSGSSATKSPGQYGTINVAASSNTPGARYGHSMVFDSKRSVIYVFGGNAGYDMNDLWQWNTTSLLWTWIKGSDATFSQASIFGNQGVPNRLNCPGGRYSHAMSIDLESGQLYLFGGREGVVLLNELWRWDSNSTWWTWLAGNNSYSKYGTQNVPSLLNMPPTRWGSSMVFSENQKVLYVFGGEADAGGRFNDLWSWDLKSKLWTWIAGNNIKNIIGAYGTKGTPSSWNMIGARDAHSMVLNPSTESLLVFGGRDKDGKALNDLWMWDPKTTYWTWIGGSNLTNAPSNFGNQSIPNPNNMPAGRIYQAVAISPVDGKLYIHGGQKGQVFLDFMNDLWTADPVFYSCPSKTVYSILNGTCVDSAVEMLPLSSISSATVSTTSVADNNASPTRSATVSTVTLTDSTSITQPSQLPSPVINPQNTPTPPSFTEFFTWFIVIAFCLLYLFVFGFFLGLLPSDKTILAEIQENSDPMKIFDAHTAESSVLDDESYRNSMVSSVKSGVMRPLSSNMSTTASYRR